MYILSRAINNEEYIFYIMNEDDRPIKAKIEDIGHMGEAIELTRKYAKENNIEHWEINTDRGRDRVD
tara:strand:- start:1207 stop:1407 length:201 start_codon:yes stop_codon:yes gene_type:complete